MKTCLKTYHHSEFDDKKSPARKINVELTAGGGGNTKARKGKIAEKNSKLTEQRTRRIGEEEKQKLVKRGVPEEDQSGIHPSRRARVA
jgi:nucleolar protein 6